MPLPDEQIDALLELGVRARLAFPRKARDLDGLDPNSLQVLLTLARHPNDSTVAIAHRLQLKQGTVAAAVRRLEGDGYVNQQPAGDNPSHRVRELTNAGRDLVLRVVDRASDLLDDS